jgi:DNA-binding response OmpR family regulator
MSAKMSAGYAAEEVSRSGETVSKLETDRNGRPLVLVADDEEDILILVSIRLDRAGCEVVTATNGKHALDLILERRPDIAVLDVRMPRLTGIEVLRRVRASAAVRDTPVLLLSAGVQEESISQGLEAGANEYMKKPFSPDELAARVEAMLG